MQYTSVVTAEVVVLTVCLGGEGDVTGAAEQGVDSACLEVGCSSLLSYTLNYRLSIGGHCDRRLANSNCYNVVLNWYYLEFTL